MSSTFSYTTALNTLLNAYVPAHGRFNLSAEQRYLCELGIRNRCANDLRGLGAPDEVLADRAGDHLLRLVPRLVARWNPLKGTLNGFVEGARKKVCRQVCHRYHREHQGPSFTVATTFAARSINPLDRAIVNEVMDLARWATSALTLADAENLRGMYPEIFGPLTVPRHQIVHSPVRLCRAKARLIEILVERAPHLPWVAIGSQLMPRCTRTA